MPLPLEPPIEHRGRRCSLLVTLARLPFAGGRRLFTGGRRLFKGGE